MDLKQNPYFFCIQEAHLKFEDKHYHRVKGWENIFQSDWLKIQAGVSILISNKIVFKLKWPKRDGEEHYIFIIGKKIHQDEVSILNVLCPKYKGTHICKRSITKT